MEKGIRGWLSGLGLSVILVAAPFAMAADYEREKKWADEVLPSVLTGDPVWLEQANGHRALGLYTPVDKGRVGVVVVHGIGVHPDWGLISGLRQNLPEAGYATLSVQMPVLRADAKGDEYVPSFDEAAERLALAVKFLRSKGYAKVAVVSHSLGSRMSYHYLRGAAGQVDAWVSIGLGEPADLSKLAMPVLDLIGQNDLAQVLRSAPQRQAGLKGPQSLQKVVPGADHFFDRREEALLQEVRAYLESVLGK